MNKVAPTPHADAIAVRGVHKHYGALHAVQGVDLAVQRGEVFGLIGHNGAGKSTLFKMMLGLIPISAGEIIVDGARVGGPDFRAARRRIGYLPENVVLYDNLSAHETLHFFAKLKGIAPAQREPESQRVLDLVGLSHAARRHVREYSKGMRQRLGFAQALLGSPQVLFLDEPTSGLDPEAIRSFYATLRGLREQGVTMIITSHILAELQERVDRLAILSGGKIQAVGSVQGLREQMNMPLQIEVICANNAGAAQAARAALACLPESTIDQQGDRLTVRCPRASKMAALSALAQLAAPVSADAAVQDIKVIEPSLEDVFFGFAD
ncbi:ABC transporter ATP-binding protein [Aquabacterium sp.]|uniref:ABC transporter ATP-binding protein n=1 Tax=Aquabacterium sp. TaxID=1872578 RepID=UPI0035B48E9E